MLGAAVIGLGVGEAHARAYHADPRCTLTWVYDLDASRAAAVAETLPGSRAASSYADVLRDPATRIISIASVDDAHYEQVMQALEAGKHVFVEKPLCRSEQELRAVEAAWRAAGVHLASNLILRAAPLFRWLDASIRAGEFGDIYAVDGDYLYGRLHKITGGWRAEMSEYSVMQGGGVHLVDLMLTAVGEAPVRVSSAGNRICTQGTAFRYHDFVASTFVFPGGAIGRISANFGCVHPHQHVLRVFGTRRTFILDDRGPRYFDSRDPERSANAVALERRTPTKGDLIPWFIGNIVSGAPADGAAEREFMLIRTCLAADAAIAHANHVEVARI